MNERPKILLVDDEKRFRETSQRILAEKGFEVIGAENGQIALDLLSAKSWSRNTFDLVLLDLKMPVMGGEEFLKIMRPLYPDVPVIIISGHGTLDIAVDCMKKGAYDFISKPFGIDQLLLAIDRALEKKRLENRAKELQEETVRNLLDLTTEKKKLETIINCMANGVMVTNRNLEVILHNPALMRLLGLPEGEKIEAPLAVSRIIHDDSLLETLKRLQGLDPLKAEFISQEIRAGERILRAISAPTLGPDRNVFWAVAGAVTVLEDITPFKQLDQMKSDFVNMVAHELRSPLVSIRQMNSVLSEGLAGPLQPKQQEFVERGMKKIDALLELINDLLDVARLEEGRLVRRQVPVDIGKVIEEIVALMEPRAKKQGITITHSCENLGPVLADPKNLEEIFNNLISNAINYSPEGGRITVTATSCGAFVKARVEDTGIGIPPEELPKIFEKFYRVKHPKTRRVAGTGLGLSIVKGIVEAHRGRIEVESVPDQGTAFTVFLPVITEQGQGPGI